MPATPMPRYSSRRPGISRRDLVLPGVMMAFGAGIFGYGVSQVGDAWWETSGSRGESDAKAATMVSKLHTEWSQGQTPNPGIMGQPFATITVAKFGSGWIEPIVQGTSLSELGLGVGHVPGSAMPGQLGNMGIAGHRTTRSRPFNRIAELVPGDTVTISTSEAIYTYTVTGHKIVKPTDVQVFAPVANHPGAKPTKATLTMSSCHPFYSDTERYVVFATLSATHAN